MEGGTVVVAAVMVLLTGREVVARRSPKDMQEVVVTATLER